MSSAPTEKRKKKRSKAYYMGAAKRQRNNGHVLDVNQKGFFITCGNGNGRTKSCINEAYALLGQFADSLYGSEEIQIESSEKDGRTQKDDVEAEIAAEIEGLKRTSPSERRFQAVDCGVKNCVFIRTQVPDPCELAFKIMDHIRTTGESVARYMCRLIPVAVTCRGFVEDIRKAGETLLPKYFEKTDDEGKTYCIVFKARCNQNVSREAVHDALNPIVQSLNSAHKVELKTPQLVIIVEVMAKICCLSVVPEYFQLRKYNVVELAASGKSLVLQAPKNVEESSLVQKESAEASKAGSATETTNTGSMHATRTQDKDESIDQLQELKNPDPDQTID